MNTTAKIIIGILIGLCAAGWGFYGVTSYKDKQTIVSLTDQLSNCQHAPTRTDTIIRYDTVIINKVRVIAKYHTDTIIVGGHVIPVNTYQDTLRTKDFDLAYQAKTVGLLKEMNFPWYRLHTREIITYKTVDTCFMKKPSYQPKNHLGLDLDLIGSNITRFPNVDAVMWWSVQDKFKLNAGVEYNTYNSELYAKIGIGIFFR